jgi:mono/diheme cytochrome c family protein
VQVGSNFKAFSWRSALAAPRASVLIAAGLLATCSVVSTAQAPQGNHAPLAARGETPAMLDQYCSRCHNDADMIAKLSIDDLRLEDMSRGVNLEQWEKILRRTAQGEMPPHTKAQPDPAVRASFVHTVQTALDGYGAAHPDPGRATLRRLNRTEYANAVRDLLALDIDLARELPQDDSGYGFDNIADVLSVSPTLMARYVAVAGKVGRIATGLASKREFVTSYDVPKDGSAANSGRPAYNERASDDLPLGSRGGGAFSYFARHGGNYEIAGWLNANTNNETDRLTEDRFAVRLPLKAGAHVIGMSFARELAPDETVQTLRNDLDKVPLPKAAPRMLPLDVSVDGARAARIMVPSYRLSPRYSQQNFPRDVLQIDVAGPFNPVGISATPSRKRIFTCQPKRASAETPCAQQIAGSLARAAFRRPVTATDLAPLMKVYASERAAADFEHGVEAIVEAILVSPQFLFVIENDAAGSAPGSVHPVGDVALATRLSLFLWSSIPDETLLLLAEQGQLGRPDVLDAQITRMLADPRSAALTRNFAGQWLYLRNLDQQKPDPALFPDFDTRLRSAMARETEMFFTHVLQTNRSVLDFIAADYTFLNQRLAQHYGIAGVNGTAFRRVSLDPASQRGGLLGQASILTVTSYGNHTSVVKRGKWILDNLLSAPPPPPPADVPALKERINGRLLPAREQLEAHRASPACSGCHVRMDPLGFSLENFDAIGAYRQKDAGQFIDASASLPDGTNFKGLGGLQQILITRKDEFTRAFTERLMTYALARGIGARDMPSVRKVAQAAADDGYRIQTIVRGIVTSVPFQLRKVPLQ